MRLLVTGAAGFLGRNILQALPAEWDVVALHHRSDPAFNAFVQQHTQARLSTFRANLADRAQLAHISNSIESLSFDACLYLASNTDILRSISDPAYDLASNTLSLLNVLEQYHIGHLIYLSSGAVYVGCAGLVGPQTPVTPDLPYAISKLAAEQYIHAFLRRRGNPQQATIIRFFGAYGPYEPARKLYTKLVRQFAFARDPHFTITGDGDNYIDAMYVDDAVRALLTVIGPTPNPSPSEMKRGDSIPSDLQETTSQSIQALSPSRAMLGRGPGGGAITTIDLGAAKRETVNSVVQRAARTFDLAAQIAHTGQTAEYITFHIDPQPFVARYGVAPEISLEDGLQRLAAHLQEEAAR